MKKLISLILALVMVMGLAVTASAHTIIVSKPANADKGELSDDNYTAHKIFDASINGTNVSYTIDESSSYYETVAGMTEYFTLTRVGESNTYVVAKTDNYTETTAAAVAKKLATVTGDAGTSLEKQEDGSYKATVTDVGYYLIKGNSTNPLMLDTTMDVSGTTTLSPKIEFPTLVKKIVEGDKKLEFTTADYGETLNFEIAVAIPANAKGEIVVHDEMVGLTYVNMTPQPGVEATTNDLDDNCEVHFTINSATVESNKGNTITIAYTAKMNAEFSAHNYAWLTNNNFTSEEDYTSVHTYDIIIDKHVTGSETTKLANAKFVLKNEAGKFYEVDSDKNVTWVDTQEEATVVTTNDEGVARFDNLAAGTYYLIETAAPAGYNKLTKPEPVTVPVNESNSVEKADAGPAQSVTAKVANSTGSELPSTGGMGTTLFYVLGGLMMVGAAVVLVTKKRVA